jgi:hypothetical protein
MKIDAPIHLVLKGISNVGVFRGCSTIAAEKEEHRWWRIAEGHHFVVQTVNGLYFSTRRKFATCRDCLMLAWHPTYPPAPQCNAGKYACSADCKGRRFSCPVCYRFVPACFGAADGQGDACDDCYVPELEDLRHRKAV